MRYYIQENLKIQNVVRKYAADEDIMWYSIDEGVVDLTASLNYFVPDKNLSRAQKLDIVSQRIQQDILRATGIFRQSVCQTAIPCSQNWHLITKQNTITICAHCGTTKTYRQKSGPFLK